VEETGFESQQERRFFFFKFFRLALGQYSVVIGVLSRSKHPGRDLDHSVPSGVEVKNEWNYTSTRTIYLHGVKKVSFTFT
jgi:hypothetical protein